MRPTPIYAALLRSFVFFLPFFNIRMAENGECVGGIQIELKKYTEIKNTGIL